MIATTSLTITGIVKIITTSPVKDFLISLAAGGSWDGIKKIVSHFQRIVPRKKSGIYFLVQCHSSMDNFTTNMTKLLS